MAGSYETALPDIERAMDERDPEAFRALYRAHYRTVCRYLAVRVDHDVVEDVAAEVFLVAWRRQGELPRHVVPWLLTTAAKLLANQRRSRKRGSALVERLSETAGSAAASVEEDLAQEAQRRALVVALAALGDADRELLLLRHWDGLAAREIATVLELGPMVTRTRLHRAGRRLQQALQAALEEEGVNPRPLALSGT
jgi:RNA polymerase sigma-70 factor, ECF subfamily